MASISKVTGSWATAYNENTLALANFNFDFSLYKVEAPQEYRDVETSLSSLRRQRAEDGALHQTARRLGALFEDTLPSIPKLINAYGQRASEISRKLKPKTEASKTYGPFNGHIGIDASSIWAGATSGPSAIAVHLLACILARTWTASEATSIWAEIVSERKKEIEQNCHTGVALPIATLLAARQDITRSQLAEWDASARAWLRSADDVKCLEQKQLTLILSNVEIAVNNKAQTYSNVLAAWKGAMAAMENLLTGIALRVQDGAVLLGFAAWHIFPDIVVLSPSLTEVHFKDPLVPEGVTLELGLSSSDCHKSQGVFWSLSLAHLRYYGSPVSVSRSLSYDESRVSMDQLYLIALGSIMSNWIPIGQGRNIEEHLQLFKTLGERIGDTTSLAELKWFRKLVTATNTILDSKGIEAEYSSLLFSYGRTQGKHFIPSAPALFSLNDYSTLLRLTDSRESRIAILLSAARKLRLRDKDCVIRYRSKEQYGFAYVSAIPASLSLLYESSDHSFLRNRDVYHYTVKQTSYKEFHDGLRRTTAFLQLRKSGLRSPLPTSKKSRRTEHEHIGNYQQSESEENFMLLLGDPYAENLLVRIRALHEYCASHNHPVKTDNSTFAASIIIRGNLSAAEHPILLNALDGLAPDHKDLGGLLLSLDSSALRKYFREMCLETTPTIIAIRALVTAATLYESFPDATVPLCISRKPLCNSSWIPKSELASPPQTSGIYQLSRAEKFSCLALFESGSCNLRPDLLNLVMAMSVGNGLYISDCLLKDPVRHTYHDGIRRAVGNIGRPGISMLYSPADVQIRPQKLDSWMLIDLKPFKGELVDSFSSTSIHLSFTGYEVPISVNPGGERDIEATLIETAVSVLDRGQWVADIDILGGRRSDEPKSAGCIFSWKNPTSLGYFPRPQRTDLIDRLTECDHGDTLPEDFPFLRIGNWDEVLSDLEEPTIVTTHQNLFARLAVAAVCMQKDRRTFILPKDSCMKCLVGYFDEKYGMGKLWQGGKPCVVLI